MNSCKGKDVNGKPCPNKVDEGQEYCPYHLSSQNTTAKKILSIVGTVALGVVALVLKGMSGSKSE